MNAPAVFHTQAEATVRHGHTSALKLNHAFNSLSLKCFEMHDYSKCCIKAEESVFDHFSVSCQSLP